MLLCANSTVIETTPGVSIPIYDLGGEGRALLISHATGFHGRVYDELVESLRGHIDLHTTSADLRGHGDSRVPAALGYAWDGFADDVEAILDHLAPTEPPFAFGHSMGAAVLLLSEIRRPGTFRAIYAYEPVIAPLDSGFDRNQKNPIAEPTRRRRATFGSRQEALENYRSKPPFDRFTSRALENYVDHGFHRAEDGTMTLKCLPEVEASVYEMSHEHAAWAGLPSIRCPVTIAWGGDLSVGPGQWAARIANRIEGARSRVFTELGHLGPLEGPDEVAADMAAFFAPLDA